MKKIAVIGCGALAHVLAGTVAEKLADDYVITGFLGRDPSHTKEIAEAFHAAEFYTLDELLASDPDYVVELAGVPAAKQYICTILEKGFSVILASIGSLADDAFKAGATAAARSSGAHLYVISGAVGGFDVMQTIALMGGSKGSIDNIKAPQSLEGAPYLEAHPLDYEEPRPVFTGSVKEAIEGFPKNVNVAVAASAAAECPDMQVVIHSVPGKKDNTHAICVENDLVKAEITVSSSPDPSNPRSSTMTAWNIAALLKSFVSPIVYY